MPTEEEAATAIVEIGRRLYAKEFVAANDGNISVRLAEDEFLVTPTGVSKGALTREGLLRVDGRGKGIAGRGKVTSEIRLHLAAYAARPEVGAVVHAHPPAATAFAICGGDFAQVNLAEAVLVVGKIGFSPYATPTTEAVPRAVTPFLADCDAILLENHGVMAMGGDPWNAYYRLESLEHYCKINIYVRMLGGGRCLTRDEICDLEIIKAGGVPRGK